VGTGGTSAGKGQSSSTVGTGGSAAGSMQSKDVRGPGENRGKHKGWEQGKRKGQD
jgi:hypothetical protein